MDGIAGRQVRGALEVLSRCEWSIKHKVGGTVRHFASNRAGSFDLVDCSLHLQAPSSWDCEDTQRLMFQILECSQDA
jgi:hypothetical protein